MKYYKLVHYKDGDIEVVTDSQFGGDQPVSRSDSTRRIMSQSELPVDLPRTESDSNIISPEQERRKRLQTVGKAQISIQKIREPEPLGVKKIDVTKPTVYTDVEHKVAAELFKMQATAYKTNKMPSTQKYNIIKMYFENAKISPEEEKELREDLDFGETRFDLIVANATKFDENGHFIGTMQPKNSSEWVLIRTNADWAGLMMSLPEERAFVNAINTWLENVANFTKEKRKQRLVEISEWCRKQADRCTPPCDLYGQVCTIKKELAK